MENWHKNHLKYFISVPNLLSKRQSPNIRKLQVGPVKPVAHKHSTIVAAVCLQVAPFKHVSVEQTKAKYYFL